MSVGYNILALYITSTSLCNIVSPSSSYQVILNFLISHEAVTLISSVKVIEVTSSSFSSNQPINSYPSFSGLGISSKLIVVPSSLVIELIGSPPFVSNSSVYQFTGFGSHFAYNDKSALTNEAKSY